METILTLENIQEYDDIILPSTPQLFELSHDQIDGSKSKSFSWLSFSIGVGVVLLSLLIISLIILFIIRYRKEHHFKPVPVYV
jgi:lipoprotein signal peptidase